MSDTAVIFDLFGNQVVEPGDQTEAESDISTSLLGRYAEFMVCAQLCRAGYFATHVDSAGFDLILQTEDGTRTMQVKSSRVIESGYCHWRIKRRLGIIGPRLARGQYDRVERQLGPQDANLLALFHHSFETTIIWPITKLLPRHIALPVHQVERASLAETLQTALEHFRA